ncbi:MAG: hypothetical protein M1838_006090 [Thelocarpon superellum]|nr:MAG: hypothetical protein M1838_006090 [Thelocarpon superellum]
MTEERPAPKRSRFDQTEPRERHGSHDESKRPSRFDRRSRSPSSRDGQDRRTRSPLSREPFSPGSEEKKKPAVNPAAAAAAAAARINAQIQARKGIQHVDVPPIRSVVSPSGKSASPPASTSGISGDIYIADGDYIKDIEVNDLRNRYTLTKGSTQKMNPPLYLHVTSTSKDGLERAVAKIEELMQQELPNLVDERRFRRREPEQVERDELGRRKWPEEKITIDIEPVPGFNVRAQVIGQGGSYVKHIAQETRCRVQIKGKGSGFTENATGQESDEPMHLHVAGPDPREVQHAKELCEDLMKNVHSEYERFKSNPPPQNYGGGYGGHGGGGYGQRGGERGGSYGGYGGYGGQGSNNAASAMSPSQPAPPGTAAAPGASSPTDYAAQYAQYYGGQDPYAAYGGYQAYCQYYAYYQQQAAQQGQAGAPGAGSPGGAVAAPPPPPPPGDSAPPPPPPSGSPPGAGYNAVPPPPGM